jgi:competence protein ComEA
MRFKNCLKTLMLLATFTLLTPLQVAHAKAVEGIVNINTASVAELTLLPGIGKAKAEQIVQMRQAKPFASIDELKNVKGLGAKRLEALRPNVSVSGPTTVKKIASPKVDAKPANASAPSTKM